MDSTKILHWLRDYVLTIDINNIIEIIGRTGALVFLIALVGLMFRSSRWNLSNSLLAVVFGIWISTIAYGFFRFMVELPAQRIHGAIYIFITIAEGLCLYVMIKEQNAVIDARNLYERCKAEYEAGKPTSKECGGDE